MAQPGRPTARHRTVLAFLMTLVVRAVLAVVGAVAGYLVAMAVFWVPPAPLFLAGGAALLACTVAVRWSRPLLWGATVGLCVPVVLGFAGALIVS